MIFLSSDALVKVQPTLVLDPFPHAVIDDFFPQAVADGLAGVFPTADSISWDISHECPEAQRKLVCSSEDKYPDKIREALWYFHSATFISFIEKVMQVDGLIVDPTHRGCGLHTTGREGYVGIHSDSSRHPNQKLDQKLNLILWLNPGWQEEYGGHLELWDRQGESCRVKIAPLHNRLALFETSTTGYHGHPHRLACPPDRRRNSLAVYYYQVARETDANHGGWREAPNFITKEPGESA